MSACVPCSCGRRRGDYSDLVVVAYRGNNSAFNGYRWTPSEYSQVICLRAGCQGNWRTKAGYVEGLVHMDYGKAYDIKEAKRKGS